MTPLSVIYPLLLTSGAGWCCRGGSHGVSVRVGGEVGVRVREGRGGLVVGGDRVGVVLSVGAAALHVHVLVQFRRAALRGL